MKLLYTTEEGGDFYISSDSDSNGNDNSDSNGSDSNPRIGQEDMMWIRTMYGKKT